MAKPMALVGAACRFPQAPDLATFWSLVADGTDAIREADPARWPPARRPPVARGGFLSSIADFDAAAFAMSPVQAAETDPQQRLMLEVAVEALEDARLGPADLASHTVGVYVGIGASEYDARFVSPDREPQGLWSGLGNDSSFAPGRIASLLGLDGPAIAFNTACSSSLVAVDAALQDLRRGRCTIAVIGAVNLLVVPENSTRLHRMGVLAPDGRSKAFDRAADGYGRAEGAGAIVLTTEPAATTLGLRTRARIVGAAVNQDAGTAGLTAPSADAQVAVIREALRDASLDIDTIDAVEAHGTGTPTGDPIELRALGRAFADRQRPLPIGSVKSNVGHLEVAAGMAGVLKALGMIERGSTLPHRVHDAPVPLPRPLCLAGSGLATSTADRPPAYIGISAFGLSGTNAHIVLGAPLTSPEPAPRDPERRPRVVVASASGPTALRSLSAELAETIASSTDAWPDIAASTVQTRRPMTHRVAVVSAEPIHAHDALHRFASTGAVGSGDGTYVVSGTAGAAPPLALVIGELDGDWTELVERMRGWPAFARVVDEAPADAPPGVVAAVALATLWQAFGWTYDRVDGVGQGRLAAAVIRGERALGDRTEDPTSMPQEGPSTAHDAEVIHVIGQGPPQVAMIAGPELSEAQLLHHVAKAWCRGVAVRWDVVSPGPFRRTGLPTTPWQAVRAWIDDGPSHTTPRRPRATPPLAARPHPAPSATTAIPTHARAWQPLSGLSPAPAARPWVIVADRQGVARALARTLTPTPRVIHLGPVEDDPDAIVVDIEQPETFATALGDLAATAGVIVLAGLDQRAAWTAEGTVVPDAADDTVRAVWLAARWARAVLEVQPRPEPSRRFWIASRGAIACPEGAAVDPTHAALWGLGATLALEHPELGVGTVDLDPNGDVGGLAALLGVTLEEDQIALRGDRAYAARLVPTTLSASPEPWRGPVLVTGGLGALGLRVAEALAAQGTSELWLVGRRPPNALATARIERLRELGTRVEVHALDVADREAVEDWVKGRPQPALGWVHAAGVLDDGIVLHLSADRYLRAMQPKVHGTLVLTRALDLEMLQKVVFCSSMAAWLGAMGQANYAAANAWLDGLAQALRSHGVPATSVALGPLAGEGMARDHVDRLARVGIRALDPTAAAQALLVAASHPGSLAMVDLDRDRLTALGRTRGRPLLREVEAVPTTRPRPAAPNRSRDDLVAWLTSRVSADLGLPPGALDPRRPLPWHGFDSLMAIELKRSLDAELGTSLPSAPFLSGPSLEGLADALAPCVLANTPVVRATRVATFAHVPALRAEGARSGAAGMVPIRLDAPDPSTRLDRIDAPLPVAVKVALVAMVTAVLAISWFLM